MAFRMRFPRGANLARIMAPITTSSIVPTRTMAISTLIFHNLNSNYNALQLSVTRQKGWLNYWGSYTFGKSLAYNAEDAFNIKRWYGPTPFDRSQILSFS